MDKLIITARFAQVAEAAEVKLFLFSVDPAFSGTGTPANRV
jgi:hypothetical protein